MSEQPPVQPPYQPPHQPSNQPAGGTSPTQPMAAAPGSPPAGSPVGPPAGSPVGPPATPVQAQPPNTGVWRNATSTSGRRWALALSAGAVALLLFLGVGVAGLLVLRNHDRVGLLGNRQDARSLQRDLGNGYGYGQGNGRVPGGDDGGGGGNLPGIPGARGGGEGGLDGLGRVLGGTALHGQVTAKVNGSVQTLVFHRGEVTAVSATSITIKSADGFAGTYGRTTATTSRGAALIKGGQALVLASASDKVALTVIALPANTGVGQSS